MSMQEIPPIPPRGKEEAMYRKCSSSKDDIAIGFYDIAAWHFIGGIKKINALISDLTKIRDKMTQAQKGEGKI